MEFRVNKSFHTEKREQAVVESALVFTVLWRVPPCLDFAGYQVGCLSYLGLGTLLLSGEVEWVASFDELRIPQFLRLVKHFFK